MSTTTSYITTATSGADDYVDLSTWRETISSGSYDEYQVVIVKEDITDNLSLHGFGSDLSITIKSDTPGVKRTVYSKHNGDQMIYSGDAEITSLTVEDLIFDGAGDGVDGNTGQAGTRSGIHTTLGTDTLTLRRVRIKNVTQHSILVWSASTTETLECDNCIFENPSGSAYRGALTDTEATFRNCMFVGCGGAAQNCVADADNTGNYYNCLSFGNTGNDFAHAGGAQTTNVRYCVSEDGTADNAHDDNTGSVALKTSTGTYFTDYDNGDYTLAQDDYTNWSINGEAANTPATDYNNTTRVNDDIGPYEYITASGLLMRRRRAENRS